MFRPFGYYISGYRENPCGELFCSLEQMECVLGTSICRNCLERFINFNLDLTCEVCYYEFSRWENEGGAINVKDNRRFEDQN